MTATQHLRFWLLGLLATGGLLWLLSDMLFPFVAGMAIAYLLDPLADRLEAVKAPRWLATTLVLSGFFLIFTLVVVLIAPLIQSQIVGLVAAMPGYAGALEQALTPVFEAMRARISDAEFEQLRASVGQYVGSAVGWVASLVGGVWRGGMAILDVISLMVITPIVAFYLLRDWDRLIAKVDTLLPRPYAETIRGLMAEIDQSLASFIRGQGMVCTILGIFYAVGLTIAGLNFGLLVGLGAGLVSFIPYVGSGAGLLVALGIAVFQFDDWTMWAIVAGIFMVGQVIEGNFLTPKLVGESVGLHPVWVMFALLAGGSLFGFTGLMLAVPVAAIIGVMVRFFIGRYLESHYFLGLAPATQMPAPRPTPKKRPAKAKAKAKAAVDDAEDAET